MSGGISSFCSSIAVCKFAFQYSMLVVRHLGSTATFNLKNCIRKLCRSTVRATGTSVLVVALMQNIAGVAKGGWQIKTMKYSCDGQGTPPFDDKNSQGTGAFMASPCIGCFVAVSGAFGSPRLPECPHKLVAIFSPMIYCGSTYQALHTFFRRFLFHLFHVSRGIMVYHRRNSRCVAFTPCHARHPLYYQ
ncbi:hypothetical protein OG21DRAFT_1142809 [Imleria badia]|nr:hypothetical protein OG21DRAFT_1142809 [Imleria badia]